MRRRRECDEELSAIGVGPGIGHGEDPRLAVAEARMELVSELVAGSTVALAQWIAALNHEPVDHAMEDDAVVVRLLTLLVRARVGPFPGAFRKTHEVGDGIRRLLIEEPNREVAFRRDEICIHSHSKRISPRRDTIFSCRPTRATLVQVTPSTVEGRPQ